MIALSLLLVSLLALSASASVVAWGSRGSQVSLVQQKLKQYGYYDGAVDGVFGKETYNAVVWFQEHNGLKAAMLRLGDSGQFPLRRRPERYPDFRITGICSNGCVWDGEKVVDHYGDGTLRENGASCGILLSYGDFDYFTAGDAGGNTRVEYPCARSIGRPVEAMKSHHHLSPHTIQDDMLAVLQPDVIVTQSFYIRDIQPDQGIIRRISESKIPGAKRMYFTNIDRSLTDADPQLYARSAGIGGHIVIRVSPGGKEYCVYMLDDSDTTYTVKQADGPFRCKPQPQNTEKHEYDHHHLLRARRHRFRSMQRGANKNALGGRPEQ